MNAVLAVIKIRKIKIERDAEEERKM